MCPLSTLCDKVCQWLATGPSVSSTNKTYRHYDWNIVESDVKHHKPTKPTRVLHHLTMCKTASVLLETVTDYH